MKYNKFKSVIYIIYIIIIFSLSFYLSLKILRGEIRIFLPWTSKYVFISPEPKSFSSRLDKEYLEELRRELELHYESLIPNLTSTYEGQEFEGIFVKLPPTIIKTNSYGFRDDEFSKEKANNTFRIIALGDSFTMGLGVNVSDTWPDQLEKKLNRLNKSIKFEVFNMGIGGYDMGRKVKLFKERGLMFDPDMVILQTRPGDEVNITEIIKRTINLLEKYSKGEIKIEGNIPEVKEKVLTIAWEEHAEELNKKPFQVRWKNVEIPLQKLMNLTKKKKINVILASFNDEPEFYDSYRKFCEIEGCYFLDLQTKVYLKYPYEILQLHPKDPHPSKFAYDIISDYMLEKILEKTEFNEERYYYKAS